MSTHLTLRGVQQSLGTVGIRMSRADPYSDGRDRFQVWRSGESRARAVDTDDIEHGYILGLRMARRNTSAYA